MREQPRRFRSAQEVFDFYIPHHAEERRRKAELENPQLLVERLLREFRERISAARADGT